MSKDELKVTPAEQDLTNEDLNKVNGGDGLKSSSDTNCWRYVDIEIT